MLAQIVGLSGAADSNVQHSYNLRQGARPDGLQALHFRRLHSGAARLCLLMSLLE